MPTQKKITYLLGAGASYNALPLVKELPNELDNMMQDIIKYDKAYSETKSIFGETKKIINEIKEHYSIDTLARKYRLVEDTKSYQRIKNIIAVLIIYKQLHKKDNVFQDVFNDLSKHKRRAFQRIDNRYDAFFSALLDEDFQLPDTIKILSWNYDFQIEKAFNFYFKSPSIISAGNKLGIRYIEERESKGKIIKLNGTGLFSTKPHKLLLEDYDKAIHEIFVRALRNNFDENLNSFINFAWETESPITTTNRTLAGSIINDSDYIVVIGYSFPVFNREVDIEIFQHFKGKKIYIQDTPERVEAIKSQLEAIQIGLSEKCETQTNLDQFLIPNEYWNEPPRGYTAKAFL
jgi:hypothetical protein